MVQVLPSFFLAFLELVLSQIAQSRNPLVRREFDGTRDSLALHAGAAEEGHHSQARVWTPFVAHALDVEGHDEWLKHGSWSRADCGLPESKVDCPMNYTISEVNDLVEQMQTHTSKVENDKILNDLHEQGKAHCQKKQDILASGGWCYDTTTATRIETQTSRTDQDYLLPQFHVVFDQSFADALTAEVFQDGVSVTDLGAGVGQIGHAIRARLPNVQYYGYDGAGNVEEFTHGYVKFVDLSRPMNLHRSDWVISSEVGEHIPNQFEKEMIANIHAHNCKGVVLTWAVLGQGGFHHVNCHSNEYIIKIFTELGYRYNEEKAKSLRAKATTSGWLAHSTMVFERVNALDCSKAVSLSDFTSVDHLHRTISVDTKKSNSPQAPAKLSVSWADEAYQLRGSNDDYRRVKESVEPEAEFVAIKAMIRDAGK